MNCFELSSGADIFFRQNRENVFGWWARYIVVLLD